MGQLDLVLVRERETRLFVVFIEDDSENVQNIQSLVRPDAEMELRVSPSLLACKDVLERSDVDIVFLSYELQNGVSLRQDFASLREVTRAPIGVIAHSFGDQDLQDAYSDGVDIVLERSDLSLGLLRQSVRNLKARKVAADVRRVQESLSSLNATLEYLEFSLTTLAETFESTGRQRSLEFLHHILETVQTLVQFSRAKDHSSTTETIGRLVELSRQRMMLLANQRDIALRVDWETARIQTGSSTELAQLGLIHLLEGLLRCCGKKDGVWIHAEKTQEASVMRVHFSRRILPDSNVLFPGALSGPGIGLDALSSMQLGALLLSLGPDRVKLSSVDRQQMLSLYL